MAELNGISRRALLGSGWKLGVTGVVVGGLPAALSACQKQEPLPAVEPGPFSVWREVQAALRVSPDHTAGRAARLVAAGDLQALHRFVRDEIRLISNRKNSFRYGYETYTGTRAALRAGAGTAPEKAEIFAELVRKTGRKARVVNADNPDESETKGIFYRSYEQPFEPDFSRDKLKDWKRRLGQPEADPPPPTIEEQAGDIDSLAPELIGLLDDDTKARIGNADLSYKGTGGLPIVEITEEDGTRYYADPIRPNGEFKPWPDGHSSTTFRKLSGGSGVSITLSAVMNDDLDKHIDLVKGSWTSHDLAGRQVRIGFKSAMDSVAMLGARIGDVRTFSPVLALQALDGEVIEPDQKFQMGDAFTLEGDRITVTESGEILKNGEKLPSSEPSGFAGRVRSVTVEMVATDFPDVRLKVMPRDENGKLVDGLSAGDFLVTDQEQAAAVRLYNTSVAPHILFLADESLSMPKAFRGGKAPQMKALSERVEAIAKTIHPDAKVTVTGTNSSLWHNLARYAQGEYSLIVYATDGDVNGGPSKDILERLANGPKTIMMDVKSKLEKRRESNADNVMDAMARATGGEAVNVSEEDQSDIEALMTRYLEAGEADLPYLVSYRAPDQSAGKHIVTAKVGAASAQTDYTRPDVQRFGKKIAGIYLTVRMSGNSVTRLIAGFDGNGDAPTEEDYGAIHGAMFGSHLIAFEGAAPSISTLMDDVLKAKLSVENLYQASQDHADSADEMMSVLEEGVDYLPGELATFMARTLPGAGEGYCFSEQGLRTVYYSEHPVIGTDKFVRKLDIMPFSKTYTLAKDQNTAIEMAMLSSLRLANGETALFSKSTRSLLQGKQLTAFDLKTVRETGPEEMEPAWRSFQKEAKSRFPQGAIHFTASDYQTLASWSVDRETGEVYGLLSDGSGGGAEEERIMRQLKEIDEIIAALNLLIMVVGWTGAIGGIAGASLGIVAAYGQRLARLYAAVSVTLVLMDASGIAPAVQKVIAGMACEIAKAIGLACFAGVGRLAAAAVDLLTVYENTGGENSPLSCPL